MLLQELAKQFGVTKFPTVMAVCGGNKDAVLHFKGECWGCLVRLCPPKHAGLAVWGMASFLGGCVAFACNIPSWC